MLAEPGHRARVRRSAPQRAGADARRDHRRLGRRHRSDGSRERQPDDKRQSAAFSNQITARRRQLDSARDVPWLSAPGASVHGRVGRRSITTSHDIPCIGKKHMTDISASEQLAQVRTWLQAQIAEYLGRDAHEIDMDSSLAELGLGSVQMLALCGDAEDRFGIVVDPEVVLDFPTPSSLAPEIAALVQSGAHA
ncbi:hypothetical protein C5B85_16435 [Pseudoclavibacter sp. AY1F1]|nr:hypothetical protein C5B85_16435 [Pseudoclavibacter sp. AY1F1]